MPFAAGEARRLLEKKLADLERKTVLPAPMLRLAAAVTRLQLEAGQQLAVTIDPASLTETERNLRGAALLPREAFPVDWVQARSLFFRLVDLVGESEPHLVESLGVITESLDSGELDLDQLLTRHLAGDDSFFAAFGGRTPRAPRLLNFLVQAALTPGLAAAAQAAFAHFPPDRTWNFGHCPVCASPPLIARLEGHEGVRFLTCSFCQLHYRAKRLLCPYCGEEDQKQLELFTSPDEPGYVVQVCLRCKAYLKTADFREFDRPSVPALDDLESLTLDLAAQSQGFIRPVLSAWGF